MAKSQFFRPITNGLLRVLCPPCAAAVIVLHSGSYIFGPADAQHPLVIDIRSANCQIMVMNRVDIAGHRRRCGINLKVAGTDMGDDFAVIAQAAPGNHQTAEAGAAVAGGAVLAGDHNGLGRESQGDFPGAAAVARVGAAGNFWQRRLQTASLVRQGLQLGIQFFPVAVEFLPQDAVRAVPAEIFS